MNDFTLQQINSLAPDFVAKSKRDELERTISTHFISIINKSENIAIATSYRDWAKVDNTYIEDYLPKKIVVDSFGEIWTSLRFKGGDLQHPFIQIEGASFEISEQNIPLISETIKSAWNIFHPLSFRILSFQKPCAVAIPDQYFVAGFLNELNSNFILQAELRVEKLKLISAEDYKIYSDEYEIMLSERSYLRGEISVETEVFLNSLTLFKAFVVEDYAGLIGYTNENSIAIDGYYVAEEFLLKKYRGKGLAKTLQSLAIEDMKQENKFPIVWGTIHHLNIASLKTALSIGRKIVTTSWFVNL